jgi:hypothetical protein
LNKAKTSGAPTGGTSAAIPDMGNTASAAKMKKDCMRFTLSVERCWLGILSRTNADRG